MPYKQLPSNPSLDHLKYQAKDLQSAVRAHDPQACQRVREFHPRFAHAPDDRIVQAPFSLADAQLAIAREYCFPSWSKLKASVSSGATSDSQVPFEDRIENSVFRQAVDRLDSGDEAGLRALLEAHPQVVRQRVFFSISDYFGNPCLLEFIAENPIRNGKLPPNIVTIARVILVAGAAADKRGVTGALALVVSGKVPRECGVQVALIDLLCDYGADSDGPMLAALGHGEFEAVEALIRRGAKVSLPVAAATGRVQEASELYASSGSDERRQALALATQFGRLEVVKMLLEAGESPNGFNPPGTHSHSTPLHQAALAGHLDVVQLLVERGADRNVKDILFGGTPLGWAEHGGQSAVAEFLRSFS